MRISVIVLAVLTLAAPAFGQQPLDPKKPADQAQRYVDALNACDQSQLPDLIDPDVSSMGANGQYAHSKELYLRAVQAICASGARVNLKIEMKRSEQFGDIALAVFDQTGSADLNGQTVPVNQRVTMVLRRGPQDGVWRVLHTQTANAR